MNQYNKENDYSDFFGATCPDLYANTRYNLYLRMDKLMKNHLMFLHDRRVPTSNNEAERQLRNYKRKQKQVVSFRSNQSHDYLCKSMSMLVVMRQNESNLFDRVSRILDYEEPVVLTDYSLHHRLFLIKFAPEQ